MVNLTFGPVPEGENPSSASNASNANVPTDAPVEANSASAEVTPVLVETTPAQATPSVDAPKPGHFRKRSLIIAGVAGFVLVAGAGAYFSSESGAFKGSFRDIGSTRGVEDRAIVAEVAQQAPVVEQEPVVEQTTPVETVVAEPVKEEPAKVEAEPVVKAEPVTERAQEPVKTEEADSTRVARKPRVAQQPVIQNSFSNEEPKKEEVKQETELVATIPVFSPPSFKFLGGTTLNGANVSTIFYENDFKQAISLKYLLPIYETYDEYDYNGKLNPSLYTANFELELCNTNLDVCDQIGKANNLAVKKNVKDVESRTRTMTLQAVEFKSAIKNFLLKKEDGMMLRFRVLDPRGMYHYTKAWKLSITQKYLDALK